MVREFLRGLRAPHPAALLGGILLFAGAVAGVELALRAKLFAGVPRRALIVWTHDAWSHISHQVGRMAWEGSRERLLLLGSSALHHSYYGPAALQSSLKRLGVTPPPHIDQLHTPAQSFAETLRIVDNLPPGRGPLLITTTPTRFRKHGSDITTELRDSHVLLRSPRLDRVLARHGLSEPWHEWVLPYFFNYLRLYFRLNRRRLIEGELPSWNYFVDRDSARGWRISAGALAVEPPPYPRLDSMPSRPLLKASIVYRLSPQNGKLALQLELLREAISRARELGYSPILVESPLSPPFRRTYPERALVHRRLMEAVAGQEGVPYWDFLWALKIDERDYLDTVHLRWESPGRLLYHQTLAATLARWGKEEGKWPESLAASPLP